jgi:hypothetical protein
VIHLRAKVRCGNDGAGLGNERTRPEKAVRIPVPDWIEIEQGSEDGYLLVHVYLREGPFIHTWHASVEEAKAEAKAEFSVEEDEWESIAEEDS